MGSVINLRTRTVRTVGEDIETQHKRAMLRLAELECERRAWELRCAKWALIKRALFWGVVAWFALHVSGAHAQQTVYRDSAGRTVATSTGDSEGTVTYRDAGGRTTSTLSRDGTIRDARGRTIGRIGH